MDTFVKILFGGLFLVLCLWLNHLKFRRIRKKDLAFSEYLTSSSLDGFEERFSGLEAELLEQWIADFQEVEKSIARAIEEGGTTRYGKKLVRERLKDLHPFLVGLGLERAVEAVSRGERELGEER